MVAVPFLVSLAVAAVLCPAILGALRTRGSTRPNYRGVEPIHPAGIAIVATVVVALPVLVGVEAATGLDSLPDGAARAAIFVLGVALLGLFDDLLGDRGTRAPRGVRAHLRALGRRGGSTGVLKALGTAALAVAVVSGRGLGPAEVLLAAAVLTLSAHVFNLLDLRPGRSLKVLGLVVAGLSLGSLALEPLGVLGLLLAPLLVLFPLDLRERAMLGDTGAGAVGAVAGLWMVLTLSPLGQGVALLVLAAVALFGELRSITALVARSAVLSRIDSLGRNHA